VRVIAAVVGRHVGLNALEFGLWRAADETARLIDQRCQLLRG
jgi:hypothetical protein